MALLRQGDFARGWVEHEWRTRLPSFPVRHDLLAGRPLWTGAALRGLAKVGLVAPQAPGADTQFEVRAFAAPVGVDEDPVTGSLNAAVAQWLIGAGLAPPRYIASQGTALGRAGRVYVEQDGDTIWRPLNNPSRLAGSYFVEENIRSFGLHQRDRDFESYQDSSAHYERRPSLDVEPVGDWGKGVVRLFPDYQKAEALLPDAGGQHRHHPPPGLDALVEVGDGGAGVAALAQVHQRGLDQQVFADTDARAQADAPAAARLPHTGHVS